MINNLDKDIKEAAEMLVHSTFTTAYTGAGISVESGIPPFRGEEGLWSKYDPRYLELNYFLSQPEKSWEVIKQIFYDFFDEAKPNAAHLALARMEKRGMLNRIITQNIDNLHQEAGSTKVYEFHGNSMKLVCLTCSRVFPHGEISLDHLPPHCPDCQGLLKPDFIFFGEAIPQEPLAAAYEAASKSDVFLVIGTTGEVMPANQIPPLAKQNGAKIIEVNPEASNYTSRITDLLLKGKAGEVMTKLENELFPTPLQDD
ncbi:MAG: NAD-dependent deacylase [Bacteroidales bacterium]|nr:NAD-dependent deacylase [Bacteroidales bacterium]